MTIYVDEDGVIHEDAEAVKAANASKASFKLDLIETVNADPLLEPSDLKLMAAYLSFLQWPKREAWVSTSRAIAMTGLSERQIRISRLRLAGKGSSKGDNKPYRVYLVRQRVKGATTIYRVQNPWLQDARQHVAVLTEFYREQQRERQAQRRLAVRPVPAMVADTEMDCPGNGCGDVPAMVAGNSPIDTPEISYEKEGSLKGASFPSYGQLPQQDPSEPYPAPETAEELASAISDFAEHGFSDAVIRYFRQELLAGRLTPAIVEKQRRLAA